METSARPAGLDSQPKVDVSSPKVDVAKSMPWVKYNPSPSSASPSASILKRRTLESEDITSCEASPISTKRPRFDPVSNRRVHFNEDPVSDSVEIPRAPDGKHTRKKLQLSGYDQDIPTWAQPKVEEPPAVATDSQSQGVYRDSPPVDTSEGSVYPELVSCVENISNIIHHLATGTWAKVLETDLKSNTITKIGQLAAMDPCQIRTLRGVRPSKVDTVKSALKTFHLKLIKEGKMEEIKKEKVKAPVEEVTTPEDEEKIKMDLFMRPSPSPIDLEFPEMEEVPGSPVRPPPDSPHKVFSPVKMSSPERQASVSDLHSNKDIPGHEVEEEAPLGEQAEETVQVPSLLQRLESSVGDLETVVSEDTDGLSKEMCWDIVKRLSTIQGKFVRIQDKVFGVLDTSSK